MEDLKIMAYKSVFNTPNEMVEHVLHVYENAPLKVIRVKSMGDNSYGYCCDNTKEINIGKVNTEVFVILNTVRIFMIDYIEEIEFIEKESGQVHCYSVDSHYFRKFFKDEVLGRIEGVNRMHEIM